MKMIAVLIVCLVAVASAMPEPEILMEYNIFGVAECRVSCNGAFATCPEINCPKPPVDATCARPNCAVGANRNFVFASADPTSFYQCLPQLVNGSAVWVVIERACGCRTYFDYAKQACVHPFEFTPTCSATSNPLPPTRECVIECPTC
ncbi:unnamed protein product [Diamesa serratosioi]